MPYDILSLMKNKLPEKASSTREIKSIIKSVFPLAKGSLSQVKKTCGKPGCKACRSGEGHPAWIFTFRRDGKMRCMHVKPKDVEIVSRAIENGRMIEKLILDEGEKLIEQLRKDS